MPRDAKAFLAELFDTALEASQASLSVPANLPDPPKGRTVVVGAGKAGAAMAQAVEQNWSGALEGLVVVPHGYRLPCHRIEIVEAAHPVPDAAGVDAARRILALAQELGPDDLLLCLISGGGSSLLALPGGELSLADKRAMGRALLASGAAIDEINTVRKHLSGIKGGRLAAAAHPARVVSLLISDVPGDDPSVIASGPTVGEETSVADARDVLTRYGIEIPEAVERHLDSDAAATPDPDDERLSRAETHIVAGPQQALEAAAKRARAHGVTPVILGNAIEGEAREVGKVHAGIAFQVAGYDQPAAQPAVLLSGGEVTVTLRGKGRGGPNTEFLLGFALAADGAPHISALAGDTDGKDGSEDNAGAFYTEHTPASARALDLRPEAYLEANDAFGFFDAVGNLVRTGPTFTNVNDFRAVLIGPAPGGHG